MTVTRLQFTLIVGDTVIKLSCTNCGSPLTLDLKATLIECPYCKQQYLLKELLTKQRIENIDRLYIVKPLAENALTTHRYMDALVYFEEVCNIEPTEISLARYNLCLLACRYIEPTNALFHTFDILSNEERYEHIHYIFTEVRRSYCEFVRTNRGNYRGMWGMWRYYSKIKRYHDMVKPTVCLFCSKDISEGVQVCRCGVTRDKLVKFEYSRRRNIWFTVGLVVVYIIVFGVFYLLRF